LKTKIFFFYFFQGLRLSPLGTAATVWLTVPATDDVDDDDDCGPIGGMRNWKGRPKYSEKTCPSTTLFTTNPT
jgi:hypothetical protein